MMVLIQELARGNIRYKLSKGLDFIIRREYNQMPKEIKESETKHEVIRKITKYFTKENNNAFTNSESN